MSVRAQFTDLDPEFEKWKNKLEEIVSELDKVCGQTRQRKRKFPKIRGVAAVGGAGLGAAGVMAAFILAPFTGGISLAVAGGAAAASGALVGAGAVVKFDNNADIDVLQKMKTLVTEFCQMVQPLKDIENIKIHMFEKLSRKPDDLFKRLQSLTHELLTLSFTFKSSVTVQRLLEVTEQCRTILQELTMVQSCGQTLVKG